MKHFLRHFLFIIFVAAFAAPAAAETRTFNTEQMSARIMSEWGKVRVVFVYSSTCPACVRIFDDFVVWAEEYKDKASILAFSTDKTPGALDRYLGSREMPFERIQIEPWEPGKFNEAMKPAGIKIGKSFGTPLFAVIDADNNIVGQYEGTRGLKHAQKWLRQALGEQEAEGGLMSIFQ